MKIKWSSLLEECVDFTQRLIQTPSMSGEEEAIATLVAAECRAVGFDEVRIDERNNVIARLYGSDRSLPMVLINSHLDHVDPGDLALWSVDPFAAITDATKMVGRGTSDIKGPLATSLYALAAIARSGERPRRTIEFSAVVEEEVGGAGAIYYASQITEPVGLIVICEPSSNQVSLGHRGLRQVNVTFTGVSAHASAPWKAVNPNYALGVFLSRLQQAQDSLNEHPRLGRTTVSPTIIKVDTVSRNVTPAWTSVTLDFRTAAESQASLRAFIAELADGFKYELEGIEGIDGRNDFPATETIVTGFDTDPELPDVQRAIDLLADGLGRMPNYTSYSFATDGRHMTHLGAPIIGFAPGDEKEAHTADETITIESIREGLHAYVSLLKNY